MFALEPGVLYTKVGYSGGQQKNPSYHRMADHTETTFVAFDPSRTNYSRLLSLFWNNHEPQGARSRQYRSVIFTHNAIQARLADESKTVYEAKHGVVATSIEPHTSFTNAEGYHQHYFMQQHKRAIMTRFNQDPNSAAFTESPEATRINGYIQGYGTLAQLESEVFQLLDEEGKRNLLGMYHEGTGGSSGCH